MLKESIRRRDENELKLGQNEDRHFLLSLLADFQRIPIEKKMDVKLAIMQAIKVATTPTPPIFNPYISYHPPQIHHFKPEAVSISSGSLSSQTHNLPPHTLQTVVSVPSSSPASQTYPFQPHASQADLPLSSPYSQNSSTASTDGSFIDLLRDYQELE